jgi:hypothetical protein
MSFLRRLFGSGDRPDGPSADAEPSPTPSPPTGRPNTQRPAPTIPKLADLSPHALHSYFEYAGGGSSKF